MNHALAFLFPGQGSQTVGMLKGLAKISSQVEETFAQASQALGFDLWRLVQEGPEEQLNLTVHTQPALLAAGVAVWRVWCERTSVRPAWMAGHSLGEFTALVCAESLDFPTAVQLVAERGRLMQSAVPEGRGSMAAILGLEDHIVVRLCQEVSAAGYGLVTAANFNAPGQVVIAGEAQAVAKACEEAKARGAKRALPLAVSVPSHCPLMRAAASKFAELLAQVPLASPKVGVVHNVDVGVHPAPEVIRPVLAEQLYSPVRWSDTIRFLCQQGVSDFVECGPGKVLTGLNKRIAAGCGAWPLADPEGVTSALEALG
ncbi:MAG: ACP S-malonyltransferase [Methylohalobius sp.]|nr:ACP S-malonyltransferase [Methylohalobius sp.]